MRYEIELLSQEVVQIIKRGLKMSTPLEKIQHEKPVQQHWLKRIVAIVIDSIIVYIAFWIIGIFIAIGAGYRQFFGEKNWQYNWNAVSTQTNTDKQ